MQRPGQNEPDLKNVIIAVLLSMVVLGAWHFLYEKPRLEAERARQAMQQAQTKAQEEISIPQPEQAAAMETLPRKEVLKETSRIKIDSPRLHGSINLRGARFDDLTLANYHETVDPESPEVVLLAPSKTEVTYFASFGWSSSDRNIQTPGPDTRWQSDDTVLRPGSPVHLRWESPQGLTFRMEISLDENYLFTIRRSVQNTGATDLTLSPFGLLNRFFPEDYQTLVILHEGPLGVFNQTLEEIEYEDLREDGRQSYTSSGGWLGITDKYWLTALIPPQSDTIRANFKYQKVNGQDRYQSDYVGQVMTLPAGSTVTHTDHFFAGSKKVALLDEYGTELGLPLFDRAVDFGWLYFLTKPIFKLLTWLHGLLGNFGLAILVMTVFIKLLMFPLANKSFSAMAEIKELQPEMTRIRERCGDDKMRMQQEIMDLYRKAKVNPAAGCLPMLIQLPVFFALYKVLYVSIEMRHAPFYGWIQDLSAPDPTNLFTLFGLVPWDAPSLLHVGIWPIIMSATMIIQQKLNPKPADPQQAWVMGMLPYLFLFLFASFPAGLVIYWAWSNFLSILQQQVITRRHKARKGTAKG